MGLKHTIISALGGSALVALAATQPAQADQLSDLDYIVNGNLRETCGFDAERNTDPSGPSRGWGPAGAGELSYNDEVAKRVGALCDSVAAAFEKIEDERAQQKFESMTLAEHCNVQNDPPPYGKNDLFNINARESFLCRPVPWKKTRGYEFEKVALNCTDSVLRAMDMSVIQAIEATRRNPLNFEQSAKIITARDACIKTTYETVLNKDVPPETDRKSSLSFLFGKKHSDKPAYAPDPPENPHPGRSGGPSNGPG